MRRETEDIEGGEAAAERLAQGVPLRDALAVADPRAWLALDAGVREADWYRYRPGHPPGPRREHAAPLPADPALLDEPRLALALCHRDGRKRERALRRAAAHPGLLPLVVIRAADWAEPAPVRRTGRRPAPGELLERARRLFSDHVLERRAWEAGLDR
ncbi:hypothetical protein ABZ484_19575 [Streptomyces sp. NPDC006393]|uniref:hypothetical protein n=1 Tax=Streptomyces sp. NPDC006393 TaxID=3156763 RepID=UPI0033CD11CF